MDFEFHASGTAGGAVRAVLSGELTIYAAADCKTRLIDCLGTASSAELDLSDVSDIDTAGIQLLLLARRHAQSVGKHVRFTAVSRPVAQLIELYNLSAALGLPATEERRDHESR